MRTLKKNLRSKKGSSLVEVVVATGIIVTAFAGLLQVFILSSVLSEASGNITLAVNEAQSVIEEIRGHDFDLITTDYGFGGTPGNTFALTLLNGTGTITVTSVNANLLRVLVAVNWTEKNGRTMSTSLETLVAERG